MIFQIFRSHKEMEMQSLFAKHNEEIALLRMQAMQELDKTRVLYEEQIRNIHNQLDNLRDETSNRITSLEQQLQGIEETFCNNYNIKLSLWFIFIKYRNDTYES